MDVLFINDGINTAADDGELRLSLMSSMAQDESRKISERVKAGQRNQSGEGTFCMATETSWDSAGRMELMFPNRNRLKR